MATYRGTKGNDDFDQETMGFSSGDEVDTLGGDDRVRLIGGDITVNMGAGNDRLVLDYRALGDHNVDLLDFRGSLAKGYSGTCDVNIFPSTHARFTGVENFTILTGTDADTLIVGDGNDVLSTGEGDDRLTAGQGADTIDGGSGIDVLSISFADEQQGIVVDLTLQGEQASGGGDSIANIESFEGNVIGTAFADTFIEGRYAYNATFKTGAGNDFVQVARGADTVDMGSGRDRLVVDYSGQNGGISQEAPTGNLNHGYSGSIVTNGGPQVTFSGVEDFILYGSTTVDILRTGNGDDLLFGKDGNDTLEAGGGADLLVGGSGRDVLTGGTGADVFQYSSTNDSRVAKPDEIVDFHQNQSDRIDLSAIDADISMPGHQEFRFIGKDAFSGKAGELHYAVGGGNTLVLGDVDGDGAADFSIRLDGTIALTASDFILADEARAFVTCGYVALDWHSGGGSGEALLQHLCLV